MFDEATWHPHGDQLLLGHFLPGRGQHWWPSPRNASPSWDRDVWEAPAGHPRKTWTEFVIRTYNLILFDTEL